MRELKIGGVTLALAGLEPTSNALQSDYRYMYWVAETRLARIESELPAALKDHLAETLDRAGARIATTSEEVKFDPSSRDKTILTMSYTHDGRPGSIQVDLQPYAEKLRLVIDVKERHSP